MLKYTNGDIFASDAMALVNTVNTEGIMGKGLALQFKRRFPENFLAYAAACKRNEVKIGKMFIVPYNGLEIKAKLKILFLVYRLSKKK